MKLLLALLAVIGVAQSQRVDLPDPITGYTDMDLQLPLPGWPVLQRDFVAPPDCGETSYEQSGKLQGLNVLITGGDSGIGRATVIAFAREGANIAINYLPQEEPNAQDLADFLAQEEIDLLRIPGDLTDETFCHSLVRDAADRLGGLDILMGNAGYTSVRNNGHPVTNISSSETERVFRTNFFANIWLTQAVVPLLPPGGSIMFTSLGSAANPESLLLDYAASKATITHMTRALAMQLAPRGIRVNAVAPVFIYTPILSSIGIVTEQIAQYANTSAYGRPAQPAEVAPLFVSFVDPEKTFVSGDIMSGSGRFLGRRVQDQGVCMVVRRTSKMVKRMESEPSEDRALYAKLAIFGIASLKALKSRGRDGDVLARYLLRI